MRSEVTVRTHVRRFYEPSEIAKALGIPPKATLMIERLSSGTFVVEFSTEEKAAEG